MPNKGRLINFISGINGVAAGGQASVNLPVNQRYHRLVFQTAGQLVYTGTAAAKAITAVSGLAAAAINVQSSAGTGATGHFTISGGIPTAITIDGGGTGWAVGDYFVVADPTGYGYFGKVATLSTTAIATATVVSLPGPLPVTSFATSLKLLVNGVNMRDITPAQTISLAQLTGYIPSLGELPINFTDPRRNVNHHNEVQSWDLAGQQTFQIQMGISQNVLNPSLTGIMEFDYDRNMRQVGNSAIPFLQPVSQHSFTFLIASGRNDLNQLPFSYPISRMHFLGTSPGNLYQLEIDQDGNKVVEATQAQLAQAYAPYGFTLGIGGSTTVPNGTLASPPFDYSYLSDPDQRYDKALICASKLVLRVYSNIAQTLTVVQEMLPGAFSS